MARVFVTNDPGDIDLTKAAQYGELVRITSGRLNVYHPTAVFKTSFDVLQTFDPDEDFILFCGGGLSIFAAGVVIGLLDVPNIKMLVYDLKEKDYFIRSVLIESTEEELQ